MAKNNGTIKRVTRKRQSAPKTARKPRLAEEAVAEIQGAAAVEEIARVEAAPAPVPVPVVDAPVDAPFAEEASPAPVLEELEVIEPAEAAPVVEAAAIKVEPAAPPPRAVSVWPEAARVEAVRADRRFRRVAFVRAMLHRLRREAEKRGAPIVRRVAARFPRLLALHDSIRRWF